MQCNKCQITFKSNYHLQKHLSKKIPCVFKNNLKNKAEPEDLNNKLDLILNKLNILEKLLMPNIDIELTDIEYIDIFESEDPLLSFFSKTNSKYKKINDNLYLVYDQNKNILIGKTKQQILFDKDTIYLLTDKFSSLSDKISIKAQDKFKSILLHFTNIFDTLV